MHVLPARTRKADKKDMTTAKTFKDKRDAQKKSNAEAEHTWNTLFMRVCVYWQAASACVVAACVLVVVEAQMSVVLLSSATFCRPEIKHFGPK